MPAKGGSASGGKSDLIYPNFSYKVVGILYDVYNELGFGYQEKYYQRAVAIAFRKNKIKYKEQVKVSLKYSDSSIGYYFLDFMVSLTRIVGFIFSSYLYFYFIIYFQTNSNYLDFSRYRRIYFIDWNGS